MKKTIIALCLAFVLIASVGFAVSGKNQNQMQGDDEFEDASYTTYHGNGIWSTTHILRKGDISNAQEDATKGPKCYKLMGVKWLDAPDYVAQDDDLLGIATTSIGTWDDATSGDLLGEGTIDTDAGFGDFSNPTMDGKNSYSMDDFPTTGVIAVCRTWWNAEREIVEYDIMFDTSFTWGNCDEEESCNIMDYQNIATHEIGHAFGLSDLYMRPCAEQTMFGYSTEGDISNRVLAYGDITGIQTLYGA